MSTAPARKKMRRVKIEVLLTEEQIESAKADSEEWYGGVGRTCCTWKEWIEAHAQVAINKRFPRDPEEAARVANPNYVPTVDEALRHPAEFFAGMQEE